MAQQNTALVFKVTRQKPELITPAKQTPHETKFLSDIDDQQGIRFNNRVISFYRKDNLMVENNKDPVQVIREAIAKTLVFYYPLAGRLREGDGKKLMVDCNEEGVLFVEAEADVSLEEFGDQIKPPFPCLEELLYDVPGSGGVLHCPLALIQVTRLKCGGFIFALRLSHAMSDAGGLVQFVGAVAELARGARAPTILPVWCRELLNARNPPRVTCTHHEYDDQITKGTQNFTSDDMVCKYFFFGSKEIKALRRFIPPHIPKCSTFEVLTACLWRCRTISLHPEPEEEEIRVICVVNARPRLNPPLPVGYYGNAFALPMALTTARKLCKNQLGYAIELVMKTKSTVTDEYVKSAADLLATKGRPHFTVDRAFVVTDVTRAGLENVDFGWGKAVFGGPAEGGVREIPGVVSYYIPYFSNKSGEKGILVPICLPGFAMERFVKELDDMLTG